MQNLNSVRCRTAQFIVQRAYSSSASSSRWRSRQSSDKFTRDAKTLGFRSRAAFKLIEIDDKYKLFKRGQMVVDLGFAPGSWTQVALSRTGPSGKVLGIDLLPASAPEGAVAIQGDFLSPAVQTRLKDLLAHGRGQDNDTKEASDITHGSIPPRVDVVMSDMLMNTSGVPFRDHVTSMDLCHAALVFALETLKPSGHFLCKFYQGNEDNQLEKALKDSFSKVYREKPHSSRSESRENYFVAMRRKL